MYEPLLQYIQNYADTPLCESEINFITSIFVPKKFRKRTYFLQEGEVCKYAPFIVKGSMRQYTVDDKGAEHIIRLFIENWWAMDRESFLLQKPSTYFIDAWEDTDVLLIARTSFDSWTKIPAIAEMARKMDEKHAISLQKRLHDSMYLSAEQRYAQLTNTYPEFLHRFPQHIIASYLGITKESLSRIRHRAAGK